MPPSSPPPLGLLQVWLDAFSVFKVNPDGQVSRHILSRHEVKGGKDLAAKTAAAAAAGAFPFQFAAEGMRLDAP